MAWEAKLPGPLHHPYVSEEWGRGGAQSPGDFGQTPSLVAERLMFATPREGGGATFLKKKPVGDISVSLGIVALISILYCSSDFVTKIYQEWTNIAQT